MIGVLRMLLMALLLHVKELMLVSYMNEKNVEIFLICKIKVLKLAFYY